MGIHIAESTSRLAVDGADIIIKLDLAKFGPTQRKNIIKGLRTGVVHGHHESARIVRYERSKHNLPIAGFMGSESFSWRDLPTPIPPHMKSTFISALVANKLTQAGKNSDHWYIRGIERELESLDEHSEWDSGWVSHIKPKHAKSLRQLNFGTNAELEALAASIENGTTTTYDYKLNRG